MTDCVRAPVAQKVGVKSGVCFPIIVDGDVVGTMDFFATETLAPVSPAASTPCATSAAWSPGHRADRRARAAERDAADELRRKVDLILDVVSAAAAGDLTREITVTGDDAIGQMGEGLGAFFSRPARARMADIGQTAARRSPSASEELTGGQRADGRQRRRDLGRRPRRRLGASSQVSATSRRWPPPPRR